MSLLGYTSGCITVVYIPGYTSRCITVVYIPGYTSLCVRGVHTRVYLSLCVRGVHTRVCLSLCTECTYPGMPPYVYNEARLIPVLPVCTTRRVLSLFSLSVYNEASLIPVLSLLSPVSLLVDSSCSPITRFTVGFILPSLYKGAFCSGFMRH